MAKMFYSLEEAALKLHLSEEDIREMAASGQLQQFRDRDKLMFKREQIDDLADASIADSGGLVERESVEDIFADDTIPLADEGEPDESQEQAIDLIASSQLETTQPAQPDEPTSDLTADSSTEPEAKIDLSGITQMANTPLDLDDDDDLVLEQIGSGSGLLDLTRESDDTSLGTELLDEIYPTSESSDDKMTQVESTNEPDATDMFDAIDTIDTGLTSSGMFDGTVELDISTSGLENLQDTGEPSSVIPSSMAVPEAETQPEVQAIDYAGNGLGNGMLLVATTSLLLVLIVVIYALMGVPSTTTASIATHPAIYSGGLLALAIGLGLLLMFFGKVQKR